MASLAPGPPAQADPSRGKHLCQSPEGENPGERGAEGDATFSPGTQLPKVTPKGRGSDVDSQAPRSSHPHLQPERAQGRTHQETRGYGSPGKDQLVQPLGRERGGGWCWRRKGRSVPHRTCGPGAPPCLLRFRENAPGFGNLGMCLKPEVETSQEVEVSVGVSLPRTGWGELREGERGGQGDFPSMRRAGGSGHPCNTRSSTVSGGPPGAASGPEHTIWGLQHLLIWRRVHYSYKETIGDQGPQSHCQRQSGMETSIPSWRLACPWGDPQAPPRLLDTPTPPPTVPLQPWALTSSLHGDGAGTPGKI